MTEDIKALAWGGPSAVGLGGMYSKVVAAERMTARGIEVIVGNGRLPLATLLHDPDRRTVFLAQASGQEPARGGRSEGPGRRTIDGRLTAAHRNECLPDRRSGACRECGRAAGSRRGRVAPERRWRRLGRYPAAAASASASSRHSSAVWAVDRTHLVAGGRQVESRSRKPA